MYERTYWKQEGNKAAGGRGRMKKHEEGREVEDEFLLKLEEGSVFFQ